MTDKLTPEDEKIVNEIADEHCPPHNAIDEERPESHFHCSQCADLIREGFEAAIRSAILRAREQQWKFVFDVLAAYESEREKYPSDVDCVGEIKLALRGDTIGAKTFLRRHGIVLPSPPESEGSQGK